MKSYSRTFSFCIAIIFFVFLSAFSTLDMKRQDEPMPNLPSGNPDHSVGIVVRPDSTGIDVLADSSEAIKFIGVKSFDKQNIMALQTHMFDYTPFTLTFLDENYSFKAGPIHQFYSQFDVSGKKSPTWEILHFDLFDYSKSRTKEEVIETLNRWVDIFDQAGWSRVDYPDPTAPGYIRYFVLPTEDGLYKEKIYCNWIVDSLYEAELWVKLRKKIEYTRIKKIKKSEVDTYIAYISINRLSEE